MLYQGIAIQFCSYLEPIPRVRRDNSCETSNKKYPGGKRCRGGGKISAKRDKEPQKLRLAQRCPGVVLNLDLKNIQVARGKVPLGRLYGLEVEGHLVPHREVIESGPLKR